MEDIKGEIRGFVINNLMFGQAGGLRDCDSFLDRGIIDSTGVLELMAFVEKRFHVSFEDADLIPENLDSIENVAAFVLRKRDGARRDTAYAG